MNNTLQFPSRVGEEQPAEDTQAAEPHPSGIAPTPNPKLTFRQFGLSMIPLTPVPFTGEAHSMFSYIRLGVYATAAYLTFSKHRKLSYALMGAGAVCVATSVLHNEVKKG